MGYGYNIYDSKGAVIADEGDEVVFSTPQEAMLDALAYATDIVEGDADIPMDITISVMERAGEGFYR